MAYCPTAWLLAPVTANDPTPRWEATGVLGRPPTQPLILPVRDVRVLYALKTAQYDGFAQTQIPHPHEYFMPMDALVAPDAHHDPALRELVSRASATANFLTAPGPARRHGAGGTALPGGAGSARPVGLSTHP